MVIKNFSVGEALIEAIMEGSGDVIILIPGMGADASVYKHFTPLLNAAGYQTVAINLRGISGSIGPLKRLSLHDLAKDVAGVIDLLETASVHVLGRAFGNRVVRCLASDRPDLVKTIILLAAGGLAEPDSEAIRQMWKLLQPNLPKDERLKAAQLSLFSPATSPNEILAVLKNIITWSKAATAHSRASQRTPIEDWWFGGEAPILVIQGLDDLIAPPANGRALRDDFGERVKLIELENAGHSFIYEHPEVIAKILDQIPEITGYTFRAEGFSLVSSENRTFGTLVVGIDPEREATVSTIAGMIRKGSYLAKQDQAEAIVGHLLAKNFKADIGDELVVLGQGRDGSIAATVHPSTVSPFPTLVIPLRGDFLAGRVVDVAFTHACLKSPLRTMP